MGRVSWWCAILAGCWALLVAPQCALAEGWPFAEPARVLLAYGGTYQHAEGTSVHRGVDLAASPGATAFAAFAGQVTFAGRVPAGPGATCGAVTVQLPDGLKITYMPLEELAVSAGRDVGAGQLLGAVAAGGDASCAEPHLHVSVRRAELYIDPMTLLVAPAVSVVEPPVPEPVEAHMGAEAPAVASGGTMPVAEQAPASTPVGESVVGQAVTAASAQGAESVAASPVGHAVLRGSAERAGSSTAGVVANSGSSAAGAWGGAPAVAAPAGPQALTAMARRSRHTEGVEARGLQTRDTPHVSSRPTSTVKRRVVSLVPAVGLVALLGLWPLWRMRVQELQGDVIPVGDDVAAAVGR